VSLQVKVHFTLLFVGMVSGLELPSCVLPEKGDNPMKPGVNVIKLFSFITDDKAYKLECLSFETLSNQVLEFEGKTRANPFGTHFRCFLLG
jgi:hypothetical protein